MPENEPEASAKLIKLLDDIKTLAKDDVKGAFQMLEDLSSKLEAKKLAGEPLSWVIRQWVDMQDGTFSIVNAYKDLEIVRKNDKNNAHNILHRLVKEGIIERNGAKSGWYRKVNKEVDIIDWRNAPTEPLPVLLPLNLHEWVNLYPGNIIVVAGYSDAGKSAFALNFVKLNMAKFHVHYFSSEMGPTELNIRLNKFDDLPKGGWEFQAYERSSNFVDVIRPGDINILDYLEVTDEFWKVAATITQVKDKLKDGLALICLQKNRGTDTGRGGSFSLEKPRLYLALDPGQAKIVKAKNWKHGHLNPNGRVLNYKIVNGCKFLPDGDWHEPVNEALEQEKSRFKKVWS